MNNRNELISRLINVQNLITDVDIMSITGFMDDIELEKHVKRYEQKYLVSNDIED